MMLTSSLTTNRRSSTGLKVRPKSLRVISTRVEPAGEDGYAVTGDLTIKGNTRSVALQMIKLGEFNDSMLGHRIGYNGHAKR